MHSMGRRVVSSLLSDTTAVDRYWSEHVVCPKRFLSAQESEDYLEWRFRAYPLFREFSGLYGEHQDEVILDYGCGPGNDLVGFALYSRATKIIGMDVSRTALQLADERLSLHKVPDGRVELVPLSDAVPTINLPDNSVDFISCQGVLQHVSSPEKILQEFVRVLKPTGRAAIMVYNRNSVWFHLYTAYEKLIVENAFPGADVATAFSMNVDGETCPVARCYTNAEFESICKTAGFEVSYTGGYLSQTEMQALARSLRPAQSDAQLADAHKAFLKGLTFDSRGFPRYQGYHAGIGGVYKLFAWRKAREQEQAGIRQSVAKLEEADVRHQRAQMEGYYSRIEQHLAALEKEVEQLRTWQRRVLSLPGVSLAVALRRWIFCALRH